MNVIETKNLVKKFGDYTAVNDLSLCIKQGEVFGLLGPNGAGKSTTINMICGLLHPTSGLIRLLDGAVDSNKSRLGFVPQNIALYDKYTAYENVKFFGELYGLSGKKLREGIDRSLEYTGLLDVKKKKAGTFSGGMLRRLNIACALIHEPEIIIMDEPTVGIDPQSRNHILSTVKMLNENNVTVVYTTHYMEEVEAICKRIAIIDHGQVIAQGTKDELTGMIEDKRTLELVVDDASKIKEDNLRGINGISSIYVQDNTIRIETKRNSDNLNAILKYMTDQNVRVRDIDYKEVSLETVFLTLTGRKLRD